MVPWQYISVEDTPTNEPIPHESSRWADHADWQLVSLLSGCCLIAFVRREAAAELIARNTILDPETGEELESTYMDELRHLGIL